MHGAANLLIVERSSSTPRSSSVFACPQSRAQR